MKDIEMNYKRFDKTLPALFKEDERNAGFDLFARIVNEDGEPDLIILQPGEVKTIPLNLATQIPPFAVGLLFQRSSTYDKWGVKLVNNVGVIDALYCGDGDEWGARFRNETRQIKRIKYGDKLCQAIFIPILPVLPIEMNRLGNEDRGGFGTSFDNAWEKRNKNNLGGYIDEKKK